MRNRATKQLCDIRNFVLRSRVQLRFGRLSRAPLQLLRLEWRDKHVDCDWIARSEDEWDQSLPPCLADRDVSLQALEDAIEMRDLLFYVLQDISSATLRVYRQLADSPLELIIAGTVARPERVRCPVGSLAMQAKLSGLQFSLDGGRLVAFQPE
jgi:hypothetical protein